MTGWDFLSKKFVFVSDEFVSSIRDSTVLAFKGKAEQALSGFFKNVSSFEFQWYGGQII